MGTSYKKLCRLADEELMIEIGKENAEAFEIIYDRHSNAVYSLSYRIIGNSSGAEEICQDCFMAMWRGSRRYQAHRGSVRSWLLTIARNGSIDHIRRIARQNKHQTPNETKVNNRPDSIDLEKDMITRSEQIQAKQLILTLPVEQQQVVELSFYSGYSHREIASHLDLPLGTVKGRMNLALKKMRNEIGDNYEMFS